MSMCWPRPDFTRPSSAAHTAATPWMPVYMSASAIRNNGGGSPATPTIAIAPLFASAISPKPACAESGPVWPYADTEQ
jgi:hypothetical protein